MVKLKTDPITKDDISNFLTTNLDFPFEIKVFNALKNLGFECQHGGAYEDPVTGKYREFDIRGQIKSSPFKILIAVECKNLKENHPLIVLAKPRAKSESFHHITFGYLSPQDKKVLSEIIGSNKTEIKTFHFRGSNLYPEGEMTGKFTVHLGRNEKGEFVSQDGEIYDKWSQAINSTFDLAIQVIDDIEKEEKVHFHFIFPILVVPDETLWMAGFDNEGNIEGEPIKKARIPFFLGKEISGTVKKLKYKYQISHLEILTLSGLIEFFDNINKDNTLPKKIFHGFYNNC